MLAHPHAALAPYRRNVPIAGFLPPQQAVPLGNIRPRMMGDVIDIQEWRSFLTGIGTVLAIVLGLYGVVLTITLDDQSGPNASTFKIVNGLLVFGAMSDFTGILITSILAGLQVRARAPNAAAIRRIIQMARIPVFLLAFGVIDLLVVAHIWLWASQFYVMFYITLVVTLLSATLLMYIILYIFPFLAVAVHT